MSPHRLIAAVLITVGPLLGAPDAGSPPQVPAGALPAAQAPMPPVPPEESSVTSHTIRVGGQVIPYTATASTILLKNDAGDPIGLMYSVAYVKSDVTDKATRPVTFLYNGGPGSASMWLHMGSFGPKRVVTSDPVFTPAAPYGIVDNSETLLHKTDLVFVDAMGTGFSRIVGRGTERDFYGVDEDAQAFAQFIVTYLSRNGRWNSPKFLIGESYGTFRSAAVGNLLQSRYNVHLNGINLLSMVLDLSTLTFAPGDDRAYLYYLPSYAAVAWYHKVLPSAPATLTALLDEAREYARGPYATALFKGDALPAAERAAVAKKLASLTGLSEAYLLRANLRVTLAQFNAELMRERRLTAGRIDARFAGDTFNMLTETAENDPFNAAVGGAFTAAVNHYTRQDLKFGGDRPYHTTNGAFPRWNWTRQAGAGRGFPGAPNVQNDLAQAMITNPSLVVQVENGYYDMATPFFPAEFTMAHLAIPDRLRKNITLKYYESGHMMYLRDVDRVALRNNMVEFIDRALKMR
jgi:carboxypeptidase C (cathepsin A)